MSDPRDVIAAICAGQGLSDDGAALIARGLSDGTLTEAQAGAFAMAVMTCGAGASGRAALTKAMRDSGEVMHWDLPGPVVDKHSTGGVGDCVSVVLAPLLASCGVYVPMISGRGLGHTGGTLDKLEAIPGFRVELPQWRFKDIVAKLGCAIVAASASLAPADGRLYAIRDETATVGSIDLITASILSKKLAAGLDALVLDVKLGSGAFLTAPGATEALAQALVQAANDAGCRTTAFLSDMDQPLARNAGNALEVRAAIEVLRGDKGALRDLVLALAEECLRLAGTASDRLTDRLDGGHAAEVFGRMVALQGGPSDLLERPGDHLKPAPVLRPVPAVGGHVTGIDVTALGHCVVALGGGRMTRRDIIDPRVGLTAMAKIGEAVGPDAPLAIVHAADDGAAERAVAAVQAAYRLGEAVEAGPLLRGKVG